MFYIRLGTHHNIVSHNVEILNYIQYSHCKVYITVT